MVFFVDSVMWASLSSHCGQRLWLSEKKGEEKTGGKNFALGCPVERREGGRKALGEKDIDARTRPHHHNYTQRPCQSPLSHAAHVLYWYSTTLTLQQGLNCMWQRSGESVQTPFGGSIVSIARSELSIFDQPKFFPSDSLGTERERGVDG